VELMGGIFDVGITGGDILGWQMERIELWK